MFCLIRSSVNNLRRGSGYGDSSSGVRSWDGLRRSPGVAPAADSDASPAAVEDALSHSSGAAAEHMLPSGDVRRKA